MARSATMGMNLAPFVDNGQLRLQQIDPAELSPGEFATLIRTAAPFGNPHHRDRRRIPHGIISASTPLG